MGFRSRIWVLKANRPGGFAKPTDAQVIQQGSVKADNFYVVSEGELIVEKDGEKAALRKFEAPIEGRASI